MTTNGSSAAQGRIVTANRLTDGAVVYLTPDGSWSLRIEHAAFIMDEADEKRLLAAADEDVRNRRIVGPYAMDVAHTAEGVRALSERERIRAAGPSVQQALWTQPSGRAMTPSEGSS
jgi:hypothetical protein